MRLPSASIENALRNEIAKVSASLASAAEAERPQTQDKCVVDRVSRIDAIRQQAMAADYRRRLQARRNRLAAALRRIETGNFGVCNGCGEDIGEARLRADPAATCCRECMHLRNH
jgi:DnaK suppressor protein